MSKKIYTLIVAILVSTSVFAQAPQKMTYQSVIRNSNNQLITGNVVGIKISILQGSATGTAVYTETQTPTTNANGLVTIEIGNGTGFSNIDWSSGTFFIKTETDPTGGTNYTITGTSQLLSVPYALYAAKVANLSGTNTGDQDLSGKVDKVTDKGLSTNDYTTTEQTKLAGIATGAEVNVNADWNASNGDAQIINKPSTIAGYGITDAVSTTGNQTISGNKTFSGTTTVATPVNSYDAATKLYVDALKEQIKILEDNLISAGAYKLSDIDGNKYNVVKIGSQVWMAENLKTTKYRNNDPIPNITDSIAWPSQTTGAYCWYNNDAATYKATYGALYNWHTVVDSRNLCPTGWHVPTDTEWTTLETYLGGSSVAGGKLKATTLWYSPNTGANNSSGFTALPDGYRHYNFGYYFNVGYSGAWWSTTEYNTSGAWGRDLSCYYSSSGRSSFSKKNGFSVRCLRDL